MIKYSIEILKKVDKKITEEINKLLDQLNQGTINNVADKQIQNAIDFPLEYIFVAKNNIGQIIGMLTLVCFPKIQTKIAWIEDLVVDNEYRGQGIAKSLINTAFKKAKELKVKKIYLTSRPSRIAANNLYQKMNFHKKETNVYEYIFDN